MVRAFILSLFVLAAADLPSEVAKRTVHLFTVPYAFDFSRDFKSYFRQLTRARTRPAWTG
jgi:hypothetical protein